MSMEKNLEISFLFDFYGEMLTDIQKEAIDFYYNQDLSLAEIAQHSGITRQGVRDAIKRAERQLLECEEKLGLLARFHQIQEGLEQIKQSAEMIQSANQRLGKSPEIAEEIEKILIQVNKLDD